MIKLWSKLSLSMHINRLRRMQVKCLTEYLKENYKQQIELFNTNASDQPTIVPVAFDTWVSQLQTCAAMKSLREGKQVHARILTTGIEQNVYLQTSLMNMYSRCGNFSGARLVFDRIISKNSVTWTAMVTASVRDGLFEEALMLYYEMQWVGVKPDSFMFPCVLKACGGLLALQHGKRVHGYIITGGFERDCFVLNALIDMYVKCGELQNARQIFDEMSQREVQDAHQVFDMIPYREPQDTHEMFAKIPSSQLKDSLQLLPKLPQRDLQDSHRVFNGMSECEFQDRSPQRDLVSWNMMISGYAQNRRTEQALELFLRMLSIGLEPDSYTIVSILSVSAQIEALNQGKEVHNYAIRRRLDSHGIVQGALLTMYADCGCIGYAHIMFEEMSQRDVVLWNAMIAGYSQNGHCENALRLFHSMLVEGMEPNSVTTASVLPVCASLGALHPGKQVHSFIIRSGLVSNVVVVSALLAMYSKCGCVDDARHLFDRISQRDVVSWNGMIACYTENGYCDKALKLFHQMQEARARPDSVTIASVISVCTHLEGFEQGKEIHNYCIRNELDLDVLVGSALIDLYAKCGSIEFARHVFDSISQRDVISFTAMIAGCGMNGLGEHAISLFHQMEQEGVKPDSVTFTALLTACSHAGLVDEGMHYFEVMSRNYCIEPNVEQYSCMVDLLGRAGCLAEAHELVKGMPVEANADVWGALLGACRIHLDIELAEQVARHLFELEPENVGTYVLLSNLYAAAGRWVDVGRMRKTMKDKGLKKTPGCSWIRLQNRVHKFVVGDISHPQVEKIGEMLQSLSGQIEAAECAPNTECVLHHVGND